jgi:hypothetical protein
VFPGLGVFIRRIVGAEDDTFALLLNFRMMVVVKQDTHTLLQSRFAVRTAQGLDQSSSFTSCNHQYNDGLLWSYFPSPCEAYIVG